MKHYPVETKQINNVTKNNTLSKLNVQKLYDTVMVENPSYALNYKLPKETKSFGFLQKKDPFGCKQMAQISIPPIQKSVLCGTCVGDSSLKIQTGYKNARIQCRHSIHQASWFFWKWLVCLKEYSNGFDSICLQNPDGKQNPKAKNQNFGKLKITTHARSDLTQLYDNLCYQNKLVIKRKWLNHMNNYFLMTLWLDDGSLYNKRQGVFCLDSTPYHQQIVLSKYFKKVWGIECYVKQTIRQRSNGQMGHRLYISNQQSLLKLLRLIAPIIPVREMLYKILFVPKNNIDLLERWTSEIVDLVHVDFRDQVKKHYDQIMANEKMKKI